MVNRTAKLFCVSVIVAAATVVFAVRNVMIPPSFETAFKADINGAETTIEVTCHATGSLEHSDGVDIASGDPYGYYPGFYVYAGMTFEELQAWGVSKRIPMASDGSLEDLETRNAFFATVRADTTYLCGELRENQLNRLVLIIGVGLLSLFLVGIATILSALRAKPGK